MLKIEAIRLEKGCHPHTSTTGHGCFMNVCSYLNGDEVITDQPSCTDRNLAVMMTAINDMLPTQQRQRLLPFVPRVMRAKPEPNGVLRWLGVAVHMGFAISELMVGGRSERDRRRVRGGHQLYGMLSRDLGRTGQFDEWIAGDAFVATVSAVRDMYLTALDERMRYEVIQPQPLHVPGPSSIDFQARSYIERVEVADVAVDAILGCLDSALPPVEDPAPVVVERAAKLVELSVAHGDKPLPRREKLPKFHVSADNAFNELASFYESVSMKTANKKHFIAFI